MLIMCSELHFCMVESVSLTPVTFLVSTHYSLYGQWLMVCIYVKCLQAEATGVRFDDVIRNSRIGRDQGDSYHSHNSCEEARVAAVTDDPVPHFVWTDDHADCGARQDDRIAASADPRFVPR